MCYGIVLETMEVSCLASRCTRNTTKHTEDFMMKLAGIRKKLVAAVVTLSLSVSALLAVPSGARAGDGDYIGEIMLFAGTFCPRYYQECDGRLLPIAQYQALFALVSTTYGGNGQTTFALPDLRGRVPIGQGQGAGLTYRNQGELAGTENETLLSSQMPQHNHTVTINQPASTTAATKGTPENNIPAVPERSVAAYTDAAADKYMRAPSVSVGISGSNQPHNNMQPYLTLRYCIATDGIFPSRP
jgi:microcystin-dependent protein